MTLYHLYILMMKAIHWYIMNIYIFLKQLSIILYYVKLTVWLSLKLNFLLQDKSNNMYIHGWFQVANHMPTTLYIKSINHKTLKLNVELYPPCIQWNIIIKLSYTLCVNSKIYKGVICMITVHLIMLFTK